MSAYYDQILAAIPLVLLTIPALLFLSGVTLTTAVSVGSLPAIGIMGHAMFVRAPTDTESNEGSNDPTPPPCNATDAA